jgi:hypothetical protein
MNTRRRLPPDWLATLGLLALGLAPWPGSGRALEALRDDGLNAADAERRERGYYEALLDAGRRLDGTDDASGAPGVEILPNEPRSAFESGPRVVRVEDLREYTLRPDYQEPTRHGLWTNNARGLRDREYAWTKPAGTLRVALLGDSVGAGWGVGDGDGFEPRLEVALDSWSRSRGGPAVEVLNFAVPGHAPGQRWEQFARLDGWSAGIDVVLYEATPADPAWDERRLRALLARGVGRDAPQYRAALDAAGITPGMDAETLRRRLRPRRWNLLENVYATIVAECRARGVPAAWVLLPRVGKATDPGERRRLLDAARRAGFDPVIDLSDAFDGLDPAALAVAPDDYHPNADGHARLARRLHAALSARPDLFRGAAPDQVAGARP